MSTKTEKAVAPPIDVEGEPRRWLALGILLIGAFLPVLDFTVVNLAMPAIRQDLGASSSELQFVISAYAATYAVFLVTGGRLGDWLGRKRMFVGGVAGFTLASLLCGLARSPELLIAGRILQGLTATLMAPQVLASIRVLFPAAEQGKAFAIYGATFGFANIAGQILGGFLVSANLFGLTWQTIFLINIPIGLVAIMGGLFFLPNSRAEIAQRLDLGGVLLLSATLGLLVYPLVEGREASWPWWMFGMLLASPILLMAFLRYEIRLLARGGSPLVDISLFGDRSFAIGIVMALLFYMLSSFYLTFSVYLQAGLGLSPLDAGMHTLPFALGYFLASFASAEVMQRMGPRALTLGFAVQVAAFGAAIPAVLSGATVYLELAILIAGLGYGIVVPSLIKAVVGGIDARHAGLASGMVMSTLQIGAALGVAMIGGVFFSVSGDGPDLATYSNAFAVALGCNVALLIVGGLLSLGLRAESAATLPGAGSAASSRRS